MSAPLSCPRHRLDQELLAGRAGVEPLADLVAQRRPDQKGDRSADDDRSPH